MLKPVNYLTHLLQNLETLSSEEADQALVEYTEVQFTVKLKRSRERGRDGWNTNLCTNAQLTEMLVEHIEKGDMRDVAILAMMIAARREFGVEV